MSGIAREEKPHDKIRITVGIIAIFTILACFFCAGYGVTSLVYRITGKPPEILAHVISALSGMLFFSLAILIFNLIRRHNGNGFGRHLINEAIMNAINQISRGNFEILINAEELSPQHQYVASVINDMAKSLGTLETMRQDFISNVSHEIQSPLTSIGGFAALLKKTDLPNEQRQKYAEIIEAESKRLSSLSDNLLKLSSLDNKIPLALQEFRLDKQLEHVALALEPQWSAKNITLEADLPKRTVCGDEDLLSQVWMNLLHNAVKFTPESGHIFVTLSFDDESTTVKIADTGVGISPDDQIHIFERFYKADKARDRSLGGNGLGLSLAKKIVELHGGSITVESEPTKGALFAISLPRQSG